MTEDIFNATVNQAAAQFPQLSKRIQAAADLAKRHLANPRAGLIRARVTADGSLTYSIQGSGKSAYTVTASSCTCQDCQYRHVACKHIMAVRLIETVAGRPHGASAY